MTWKSWSMFCHQFFDRDRREKMYISMIMNSKCSVLVSETRGKHLDLGKMKTPYLTKGVPSPILPLPLRI